MRKVFLIFSAVLASLLATSCYSTIKLTSAATYEKAKTEVAINFEAHGYHLSGESHDQKNEIVVTGQSYSNNSGYGTKMDNDYHQYDTYLFTNDNGETIEYSVKYKGLTTKKGEPALIDVDVLGCKTSKASDYSKLCSGDKSPKKVIGSMPLDATTDIYNEEETLVAISLITLLASVLVCIPFL